MPITSLLFAITNIGALLRLKICKSIRIFNKKKPTSLVCIRAVPNGMMRVGIHIDKQFYALYVAVGGVIILSLADTYVQIHLLSSIASLSADAGLAFLS